MTVPMVSVPAFDGNAYRKAVLVPMLASGVVSIDDPFKLLALPPDCDDAGIIGERLADVVGFWQRERNSPRYKGLVSELVKRRSELSDVLLDPERRSLARMRVQGTRRAQDSARIARLDRLLKAVVARHGGLPRSRLHLLRMLAEREGTAASVLAERLDGIAILDDGWGAQPLPDAVRRQIRSSLDQLALLGDRSHAASLWAFLELPASAPAADIEARHAEFVTANLARAHDRRKTVTGDLLGYVTATLLDPAARSSYLAVLLADLQERLTDRVLELAVVDGELYPADVDTLVRDTVALGTGVTAEQARVAVRTAATSLGVPLTTGQPGECPHCSGAAAGPVVPTQPSGQQLVGRATAPTASQPPADRAPQVAVARGPVVTAAGMGDVVAEEWGALERDVAERRLEHAIARAQRLSRSAPDAAGPGGQLPHQRLVELVRTTSQARSEVEAALVLADAGDRERALNAVLERVADLQEATAALQSCPLAAPTGLVSRLEGTTMRLSWEAPAGARPLTYAVTRVTKDARGRRVEHPLCVGTDTEAVDPDLPRAGLVWHEVVAQLGGRRSAAAVSEAQPVVPDVSGLRAVRTAEGVALSWTAAPGSDTVVERVVVGDSEAPLRRTRARGTRWTDVEVETGRVYRYAVRVEAAVGGILARTPGCTVEVLVEAPPSRPAARPAGPEPGPGAPPTARSGPGRSPVPSVRVPAVRLLVTSVPPGVVVSWEAPPGAQVTVLASFQSLGKPGDDIAVDELGDRARVVGSSVGAGTALDADPGPYCVYTPVSGPRGSTRLGVPARHVSIGAVEGLRADTVNGRKVLRFTFPRACREALVVWRADRPPADASDAEGGDVVMTDQVAPGRGWPLPLGESSTQLHLLVLPVLHIEGEPVFGPGSSLHVR